VGVSLARQAKSRQRGATAVVVFASVLVAAGVAWSIIGQKTRVQSNTADKTDAVPAQLGSSGLPIPRFVTLKTEKVNVRKGPSSDHPVAWVFQSKGLPVEIIAEFETWRRVRDSDGAEGWILQNMLSGKRNALIAPWRKDQLTALHTSASTQSSLSANLTSGAMGEIKSCDGTWCSVTIGGYSGYVEQSMLWGAYPGEVVN
jgi:SH3-like domain-containing protein